MILNVTAVDQRGVEYKNGDPFDLRLSNLRLLEPDGEGLRGLATDPPSVAAAGI